MSPVSGDTGCANAALEDSGGGSRTAVSFFSATPLSATPPGAGNPVVAWPDAHAATLAPCDLSRRLASLDAGAQDFSDDVSGMAHHGEANGASEMLPPAPQQKKTMHRI